MEGGSWGGRDSEIWDKGSSDGGGQEREGEGLQGRAPGTHMQAEGLHKDGQARRGRWEQGAVDGMGHANWWVL